MRSLIVATLLMTLVGCASTPLQAVDDARYQANVTPGPRQAQAFAAEVVKAFQRGEYEPYPKTFARDTDEAIDRLDRATERALGPDAATMIAWRAKIFHIQGDEDRAVAELERSFATAPNDLAGEALVLVYGRRADAISVGRICGPLCESIRDSDERMRMIDLCRQNTNATSVEGETAWMSPQLMDWYRAETRQRLVEQVENEQRQAEQRRRERILARQAEQCASECKQRALHCQNRCHGNLECENRCVDINNACVDGCEAEWREKGEY